MSSGFHRLGANAGKVIGWSNKRELMRSPLASVGQIEVPVRDTKAGFAKAIDIIVRADADPFTPGPPTMSRDEAKQAGYTGDICSNCGSPRMKMAGHCMVCENCGTTTGCS
jgi:hypothetical protein